MKKIFILFFALCGLAVISQELDFGSKVRFGVSDQGDVIILNEESAKYLDVEMYKACDCYQGKHDNNTLYGSCCWLTPAPGGFPPCAHGCI